MIVERKGRCPCCMLVSDSEERCSHCGGELDRKNPAYLLPVGAVLHRPESAHLWQDYQLGAVIGQGGFGATYIGLSGADGPRVAIKEYFPTRCARRAEDGHTVEPMPGMDEVFEGGRYSFIKEARVLSGLEGMPSVVQALAYLETNNTAWFRLLGGRTLYAGM